MTVRYTMSEMVRLAEKAKQPIDQFVRTAQVLEEHVLKLEGERRATPEERVTLTKFLDGLANAGALAIDTPIKDILKDAGVRKIQGTSSFATREVKRILRIVDTNKAVRDAA